MVAIIDLYLLADKQTKETLTFLLSVADENFLASEITDPVKYVLRKIGLDTVYATYGETFTEYESKRISPLGINTVFSEELKFLVKHGTTLRGTYYTDTVHVSFGSVNNQLVQY